MLDFLIYDLKVAVLIAVFYMFYRLLLSRETFHRVNRAVLLLTAVASFVLPLCVITMHKTVTAAIPEVTVADVQVEMASDAEPTKPLWQILLPCLYIIGVLATLGHILFSLRKVMLLIRQSEQHPEPDGTVVCVTRNADVAPFSWMHYMVMNRGDYEAHDAAILAHERGHIRLGHSYDVLLVDLLTALQWFNPAIWMLRQDLRNIHEYEADGAVLSQGISARQYQYLLISKATGIGGYSIANGISHSTLKKRIHMMTNKKTRNSHLLKLLALVPIIGTALALNARTITDYVYEGPRKQQPIKKGKKAGAVNKDIKVIASESVPPVETGKTFRMRGMVKDKENGEPIVGAIIQIDNSKMGTVTDMNGEFAIDVKEGDVVAAAYVGYASDVITIKEPQSKYVFVLAKDDSDVPEKPSDEVEQMPEFPGGAAAMMQYLTENIHYPEGAYKNGIQGRVVVNFLIGKDGSISDARVVNSVHQQLDAEALRVVKAMPNWTPGMRSGVPVAVRFNVPVVFKLDGSKENATDIISNKDIDVEVDGERVDASVLQQLQGGEIEHIAIEKATGNGERSKIVITTKKK